MLFNWVPSMVYALLMAIERVLDDQVCVCDERVSAQLFHYPRASRASSITCTLSTCRQEPNFCFSFHIALCACCCFVLMKPLWRTNSYRVGGLKGKEDEFTRNEPAHTHTQNRFSCVPAVRFLNLLHTLYFTCLSFREWRV